MDRMPLFKSLTLWIGTYRLLGKNLPTLFVVSGVMGYGFTIGKIMLLQGWGDIKSILTSGLPIQVPLTLVAALAVLVVQGLWWFVILPALLYGIKDMAAGRSASVADAFRHIRWARIKELFGITNWLALVITGGIILMVIPGLLFALWFCLALIVYVYEDVRGLAALQRSRELLRGRLLPTAAVLTLVLTSNAFLGIVADAWAARSPLNELSVKYLKGLLELAYSPALYIALTLLYLDAVPKPYLTTNSPPSTKSVFPLSQ